MAVKFTESFRKGNIFTKLSILIPGLGNLVGKQIIKGIMYIAIEAAFVCFMIMSRVCIFPSLATAISPVPKGQRSVSIFMEWMPS